MDEEIKYITLGIKEYNRLLKRDKLLSHLEANGVDNWEGYSSGEYDEDEDQDFVD